MPISPRFVSAVKLILVAAALVYIGYSQYRSYMRKHEHEAREGKETKIMVNTLHRLATENNAKVGWAKKLVQIRVSHYT